MSEKVEDVYEKIKAYEKYLNQGDITEAEYLDMVSSIKLSQEISEGIENLELRNKVHSVIENAIKGIKVLL